MRNERGFTLMELVVVVGAVAVLSAVSVAGTRVVLERNRVITSSDLVAAQIRAARLAAITRNRPFRVVFDCPASGAMRVLAVTGVAATDNAPDRCTTEQPNDGPAVYLPEGVSFGDDPLALEVNGRGEISALGGTMPHTLAVSHGAHSRTIVVTATGRVRTPSDGYGDYGY